jgi:PBSX family phage terminase large subunit
VDAAGPFTATPKQLEFAKQFYTDGVKTVLFGGAIRSGKTQAAAMLLVATAVKTQGTYLVSRLTYRELKDTTQKAMLYGDGALPPLIAPNLISQYRASDEIVRLINGSEILFRSLDDPGKLLNLTLNAVLIDQIEELDAGPEGERIYDTLMGRLSDPRGPRKLIGVANPTGTTHWVYRRLVNDETRDKNARYVHVRLTDNAEHLPDDYLEGMLATAETRPHWYKAFVEGEWGSFEGAAYPEFDLATHVVSPFVLPDNWHRFEAMDHGVAAPTAWYPFAVDHDGNVVCFDEYYSPGLVSEHAAEVLRRRQGDGPPRDLNWWQSRDWYGRFQSHYVYCDPAIKAQTGLQSRGGRPASVLTEYLAHGFRGLVGANNDRQAGYARVRELLRLDGQRKFPDWHPRYGEEGAPRLYLFSTCKNLTEQLRSAPISAEGREAGKAVDGKWESAHGHSHAALRYGVMSWHRATPVLDERDREPEDARALLMWKHERAVAGDEAPVGRYVNV